MSVKNLAIITARGGSKRIPKKNIKVFMGKPMISYAIEAAKGANIFDEIMVSTDSDEIAKIAKSCGANVPFMRSKKTSDDFATTYDVLDEVINEYKKCEKEFDNICCIYPCVPFLTSDILQQAYFEFINSGFDRLTPVVKYSYPIQRALIIEDGTLKYAEPKYALARSQDLEPRYHDVGMFYFYKNGKLNSDNIAAYIMDERVVQDIDTLEDWQMAQMKYRIIKNAQIRS